MAWNAKPRSETNGKTNSICPMPHGAKRISKRYLFVFLEFAFIEESTDANDKNLPSVEQSRKGTCQICMIEEKKLLLTCIVKRKLTSALLISVLINLTVIA